MSRSIAALAIVLGCTGACSSSTAPAPDPFVGSWKVAVTSSSTSDTLRPDTFVVNVTKTQNAYHVTFPDLTAIYATYHLVLADTAASSGFTGRGDSMYVSLGWVGTACYLSLAGTVNGGSATGSAIAQATACGVGTGTVGTWTALKQ